jgi:excisionase family DNA binding protein
MEHKRFHNSNEAAQLLGMSQTHLRRLCDEGRIASFSVGSALRIPTEEITRILAERGQAKSEGRRAAATADERRRARAAAWQEARREW